MQRPSNLRKTNTRLISRGDQPHPDQELRESAHKSNMVLYHLQSHAHGKVMNLVLIVLCESDALEGH